MSTVERSPQWFAAATDPQYAFQRNGWEWLLLPKPVTLPMRNRSAALRSTNHPTDYY
jgi:hypothetical protein